MRDLEERFTGRAHYVSSPVSLHNMSIYIGDTTVWKFESLIGFRKLNTAVSFSVFKKSNKFLE